MRQILLCCMIALWGDASVAETIEAELLGPTTAFNESFDEYPATSASDIVGVLIGTAAISIDINSLSVSNPPWDLEPSSILCVQVVTQDARFLAENPFQRRATKNETLLSVSPVTLMWRDELLRYRPSQIAVRATLSNDRNCVLNSMVFLPLAGTSDADTLTVLLNASNRDGEILIADEEQELEASCQNADSGPMIAYDLACTVAVPKKMRGKLLDTTVFLDDGFVVEPVKFNVFFPSSGSN